METQWYYTSDGQQVGPESASQLRTLAASGRLRPTDLVRKEGRSEWLPALRIKGLFPQEPVNSEPPPLPESHSAPPQSSIDHAQEHQTSEMHQSVGPVVLTLGRGVAEMRLDAMLRSAIFILGAFAMVSLVQALFALGTNPVWREFSRVVATVIALGVVYFLLDGIVTLMNGVDSGNARLSVCAGAILRDSRRKLTEIARLGVPVVLLELLWIAALFLGMVGKPITVLAWPVRLLAQLGIWFLLLRMMITVVLSPIIRGLKPDLAANEAGPIAWRLVRENAFYWLECLLWIVVAIVAVMGVVNYLVFFEQSATVYALGPQQAADLYGAAPLVLKGILVLPGMQSPFGGVVAPPDSDAWSTLLSSLYGLLHFLVLFPVSAFLFFLVLYPLRAAVRRLLATEELAASFSKAPQP